MMGSPKLLRILAEKALPLFLRQFVGAVELTGACHFIRSQTLQGRGGRGGIRRSPRSGGQGEFRPASSDARCGLFVRIRLIQQMTHTPSGHVVWSSICPSVGQ